MKRGFCPASNVDEAMLFIFDFLENNCDECQFTLVDLMNQTEGIIQILELNTPKRETIY